MNPPTPDPMEYRANPPPNPYPIFAPRQYATSCAVKALPVIRQAPARSDFPRPLPQTPSHSTLSICNVHRRSASRHQISHDPFPKPLPIQPFQYATFIAEALPVIRCDLARTLPQTPTLFSLRVRINVHRCKSASRHPPAPL